MTSFTLYPANRWPWYVRAYYSENVHHPLVPGEMAFETPHMSEASRDIEVARAEARDDIGEVVWGRR